MLSVIDTGLEKDSNAEIQHIPVTHFSLISVETDRERGTVCVSEKDGERGQRERKSGGGRRALIHFDDTGCYPVDPCAVTLQRHGVMTHTHTHCGCCCLPDKSTRLCLSVLTRTSILCILERPHTHGDRHTNVGRRTAKNTFTCQNMVHSTTCHLP